MSTFQGKRAMAYHEAGHAIMALRLGLQVISCQMNPPKTDFQDSECVDSMGLICVAGLASAELAGLSQLDTDAGFDDVFRAKERLEAQGLERTQANLRVEEWYQAAMKLLGTPSIWRRVERVAAALMERNELTGKEVGELARGGDE